MTKKRRIKFIYRNTCQICGAKVGKNLDYLTHLKLSHIEIFKAFVSATIYESQYGVTVFLTIDD